MYPAGSPADLDGNVAALSDEAVVDGGLLEDGGAVSLQRTVRRTGAAYGPRTRPAGSVCSGQGGGNGGLGCPVAVEKGGDQAGVGLGELAGAVLVPGADRCALA